MALDDIIKDNSALSKMLRQHADIQIKQVCANIDAIINKLHSRPIETIPTSELLDIRMQLGVEAFYFAIRKDHAALSENVAKARMDDAFYEMFAITQGTLKDREAVSNSHTNEHKYAKFVQACVVGQMKSRLDECHRIDAILKDIIITRATEAKNTTDCKGNDTE